MLRSLFLPVALAAALPCTLAAQTLPEGEFILGTYIWPDTHLPRYVTLFVDGSEMSVEVSSSIALRYDECWDEGICTYSVLAATAQANVDGGTLSLSQVDIADGGDALIHDTPHDMPYIEPVLALLDGSQITESDAGFDLTNGDTRLEFLQADAATRDIIRAYPLFLEVSIEGLAGCEVRGLHALLTESNPSAGERRFLSILEQAPRSLELERSINSDFGALTEAEMEDRRALRARLFIPSVVATSELADFDAALAESREGLSGMFPDGHGRLRRRRGLVWRQL